MQYSGNTKEPNKTTTGAINLYGSDSDKMKIFVNGRENEGSTRRNHKPDQPGRQNGKFIMRRDYTNQGMLRYATYYYNFIRM